MARAQEQVVSPCTSDGRTPRAPPTCSIAPRQGDRPVWPLEAFLPAEPVGMFLSFPPGLGLRTNEPPPPFPVLTGQVSSLPPY